MGHKAVYKYGTGEAIPLNAKFLHTQIETETTSIYQRGQWQQDETKTKDVSVHTKLNKLVWHYYEVEFP